MQEKGVFFLEESIFHLYPLDHSLINLFLLIASYQDGIKNL